MYCDDPSVDVRELFARFGIHPKPEPLPGRNFRITLTLRDFGGSIRATSFDCGPIPTIKAVRSTFNTGLLAAKRLVDAARDTGHAFTAKVNGDTIFTLQCIDYRD